MKTQNFKEPKYVGDPINAVRIFNEKQADELMILDIDASAQRCGPNFDLISKLAAECQMPMCYGGGVTTVEEAVRLVDMGVEKVATSTASIHRPSFVSEMASAIGQQSVVIVLDVRKKRGFFSDGYELRTLNNKSEYKGDPFALARQLERSGAGEIVINSIDRDGTMQGYDLELAERFFEQLGIPVTILGGAGSLADLEKLMSKLGVVGAAAGSLFVFKGKYRAVLINYPTLSNKLEICQTARNNFDGMGM